VIGFDSDHSFFLKRRSDKDEFGFLRRVDYRPDRPQVTLTDTSSPAWFQTKSEHWSYEKEWRILRVLSEADHRVDRPPLPICLFEFPPEAVQEIVVGMRSSPAFTSEVRSLAGAFPRAAVFAASEDSGFGLVLTKIC
jgi:hypothetical protein